MNYFESSYFTYKNNQLYCEEILIEELLQKFGTPLYIYSKSFFEDRYREFTNAFSEISHSIFYAVKSNFNINVINTFVKLGCGVDVNSEGELIRALKTGVNADKIILTGVGKTDNEINLGIDYDVLMIKAESEEEIFLINEIAKQKNKIAKVAIRVNPDVNPKTHPYISTGLAENKFGVDFETAYKIFSMHNIFPNIKFTGLDMHIGSQITSIEPFIEAISKLADFHFKLNSEGFELKHFDVGGGAGVQYNNEKTFNINDFANALIPILKKINCKILFEPGRFLTANGGILVAEILYTKKNKNKNFIILDSAMTDIIRPSIYGAYHHIQPIKLERKSESIVADIVGPVCESSDFLAKGRTISDCKRGDKLAIFSAGAYCFVMSFNYNGRRRPPEILVDQDKYYVLRSRETYEHLLYDEIII